MDLKKILPEIYISMLAGLSKSVQWQDEHGQDITIEPIDVDSGRYIVCGYYKNGNKQWEVKYNNLKPTGNIMFYSADNKYSAEI